MQEFDIGLQAAAAPLDLLFGHAIFEAAHVLGEGGCVATKKSEKTNSGAFHATPLKTTHAGLLSESRRLNRAKSKDKKSVSEC